MSRSTVRQRPLTKRSRLKPVTVRWNPDISDRRWVEHSALLHSAYYHVQIVVYNPFVRRTSLRDTSAARASFSKSLSICTNAATACINVFRVQLKANEASRLLVSHVAAAYSCALIMLINVYGSGTNPQSAEAAYAMADFGVCLDLIQRAEQHWSSVIRAR